MADLQARPVRRTAPPVYPTKLEVQADPDLLRKLPSGWCRHGEIAGLAGLYLAAQVGGCVEEKASPGRLTDDSPAIVAPVFEHGRGRFSRGRFSGGCVVVSAPVFMAEDEALLIIQDELQAAGLEPTDTRVKWDSVQLDLTTVRWQYNWLTEQEEGRVISRSGPWIVDMADARNRVFIEFIDARDCAAIESEESNSTVWTSDLQSAARTLADAAQATGKGAYFGAFYDPLPMLDIRDGFYSPPDETPDSARQARAAAKQESERQLRSQVRDFVDWLNAQGAI